MFETEAERKAINNTWRRLADHYNKFAKEHTAASTQLACHILSERCLFQGAYDGPTSKMVQLAEKVLDTCLDSAFDDLHVRGELPRVEHESRDAPRILTQKYDLVQSAHLVAKARELIADTDEGFPFPDMRVVDLAIRLAAPGPKAAAVSISECHEITGAVIAAYDRDTFPVRARATITELVDQLEAARMENTAQSNDPQVTAPSRNGSPKLLRVQENSPMSKIIERLPPQSTNPEVRAETRVANILVRAGAQFVDAAIRDNPDGPVTMHTEISRTEVTYEVIVGDPADNSSSRDARCIWRRVVPFGASDRHVAGGAAFVEAARHQETIAWAALELLEARR